MAAGGVEFQRTPTGGCVPAASSVATECIITVGRTATGRGIVAQRIATMSGVFDSGGIFQER